MTFHFAENYGAVLQAYALQTYLQKAGHTVEFIDYRPEYMVSGGRLVFPLSRKQFIGDAHVMFIRFNNWRERRDKKSPRVAFSSFGRDHLKCSQRRYSTWQELQADPPTYDACLCGSDQIWNVPARAGVDPAFYLDFAVPGCRRIAYAASFGRSAVDTEYRPELSRLLKKMDRISVREQSGVEIVGSLRARQAIWLPDPTLLVDDYSAVTTMPDSEAYVFAYCLSESALTDRVQKEVSHKMGLPCITPPKSMLRWRLDADERLMGPSDWMGYLKKSQFVVSNSFHGTLFSIIFRKPFITVGLVGAKKALSERLVSVLSRLGLEDRLIREYDPAAISRLITKPIDWESVSARIVEWRQEASEYLKESLAT